MTWAMLMPILLLCVSNVFMTFAWYGQIALSALTGLAAGAGRLGNRLLRILLRSAGQPFWGAGLFAVQLKTMQEIITLCVFAVFSLTYLGQELRWNHGVAFACLVAAAYFAAK